MSEPSITTEWIETKRHLLFWRDGARWAYTRLHGGDSRRWDVFDARYIKIVEILAATREEAGEHVIAMTLDGSLERLMEQREETDRVARDSADGFENYQPDQDRPGYYEAAHLGELKAKLRSLLDEYADASGTQALVKALRRAAGFDRADDQHGRVEGQHSLVLPFPRHAE